MQEIIFIFAVDREQFEDRVKSITVSNVKFVYVKDIYSVKGCTIKNILILSCAEINANYTKEFFEGIIQQCKDIDTVKILSKFAKQCN